MIFDPAVGDFLAFVEGHAGGRRLGRAPVGSSDRQRGLSGGAR